MTDAETLRHMASRDGWLDRATAAQEIADLRRIADRLEAAESTLALCPLCGNQRGCGCLCAPRGGLLGAFEGLNEEADNAHKDLEAAEAHVARLREALEWCGGSQDFAPGGTARVGWEVVLSLLTATPAESAARWRALVNVVDAARNVVFLPGDAREDGIVPELDLDSLRDALAALDALP